MRKAGNWTGDLLIVDTEDLRTSPSSEFHETFPKKTINFYFHVEWPWLWSAVFVSPNCRQTSFGLLVTFVRLPGLLKMTKQIALFS